MYDKAEGDLRMHGEIALPLAYTRKFHLKCPYNTDAGGHWPDNYYMLRCLARAMGDMDHHRPREGGAAYIRAGGSLRVRTVCADGTHRQPDPLPSTVHPEKRQPGCQCSTKTLAHSWPPLSTHERKQASGLKRQYTTPQTDHRGRR